MDTLTDLQVAYDGSFYTIAGAGGDLADWATGITEVLEEQGIGTPVAFFTTTGAAVNEFVGPGNSDPFNDDLTFVLFPLAQLNPGKLAMFKLQSGDRWFDDVVQGMRRDDGF